MMEQCQMSKLKVQMKSKAQMSKIFWILNFDIHLTFACLPVGRDFDIWNLWSKPV
jgi:hypothetical protein